MYRIIRSSDGESIGMTETPNYIKQAENGCYVLCPEPEASGIAFEGERYHLYGRDEIPDAESVMLVPVDAGVELGGTNANVETLKADLATTDDTAIELYEKQLDQEEINAEQDEALIQLFEMIGGKK